MSDQFVFYIDMLKEEFINRFEIIMIVRTNRRDQMSLGSHNRSLQVPGRWANTRPSPITPPAAAA